MTALTPPSFMQNPGTETAQEARLLIGSLVTREGVDGMSGTSLAVSQSATPAMSVDIAAGGVFVQGDNATAQGVYHGYNDAAVTLTISAAHATLARKDIVIAEVVDSFYGGLSDTFQLRVVTGTPAASPSAPSTPSNAVLLATISVAANVTSITNAAITDERFRAAMLGGVTVTTSSHMPSASSAGRLVFQTDTNAFYIADGTNWVPILGRTNISGTPTAASGWTVAISQFRQVGGIGFLHLTCTRTGATLTATSSGAMTDTVMCTLPTAWRPAVNSYGSYSGQNISGGVNLATDGTVSVLDGHPTATIAAGDNVHIDTSFIVL